MTRDEAIEAGERAIHAYTCCSDWPSNYCDGPVSNEGEYAAAVLAAVGWRPEVEVKAEALREASQHLAEGADDLGPLARGLTYSLATVLNDLAAALGGAE